MATYVKKNKADILRQALEKLESTTPIRAIGPGSVARGFAEAITTQLGDMYDAMDYNLAQSVLSTANGRSLDLIASLYGLQRKTVSEFTSIDRRLGAFYFYIDSATSEDISIPAGTRVYSSVDGFIGRQYSYLTVEAATIPAGRTRVFVSIRPSFDDSVYTAGADTLTLHNLASPAGVVVRCTNPKPIAPQNTSEDDESFRLRVIKSIRVAAAGTLDAVRFGALSIPGVRDAKVRTTPYGLGSFEMIVTPEDFDTRIAVRTNVLMAVDKLRPLGVRMYMRLPDTMPVDVGLSLITKETNTAQREILVARVRVSVLRYMNTFLPGDTLVYNRMIQAILDSSDLIQDVQVTSFAPNGVETLRRNYTPKEDQQIIPGRITVTVA